jgi:hypothetical protein
VAVAQNVQPVKTLCPHRPRPTLRERIGPRRADRCLDHSNALGTEDLVEAGGELGVPVPDEELDRTTAVGEITDQLAGHLGDELTGRMVGDAEDVHLPGRQLDHEEHVEPVVSENSNLASACEFVLVDESAQPVASAYPTWMVREMRVTADRIGRRQERNGVFPRRNHLRDSLVRAMSVVMMGVAAKDAFEVSFVENQQVVEAFRSDGSHEPFGKAVRIRSPKGSPKDLGTLGVEHVVEVRNVFGVPVADQELRCDLCVGKIARDVPGLLGDPGCIAAAEFDEEQDVQTLEQHGVDMEEVRGHDARRLGTPEFTPGWAASPGRRAEAVVLHDLGDGARCQTYPELQELTLDAPVAPPRVLRSQAQNERCRLVVG